MSQHHFDIEHAEKYGVEEAIVINCFQFWIEANRANGRNQHDGRTWTFNSVKALTELFPYWTPKQMRRITDSLEKQGVILVGNYNQKAYDKTKWYAFKDESRFLKPIAQTGKGSNKTLCPNGQIDLPKRANASAQMGKPIPVNNQLITTVNNKTESFDFEKEWDWFWSAYDYRKGEHKTKMAFASLTADEYEAIRAHLPEYKKTLGSNKRYWLSPLNYLTGKHFNDEIIKDEPEEEEKPRAGFVLPIASINRLKEKTA